MGASDWQARGWLSKGKARAELRPARRQARLPHSRSLLLPGRKGEKLGSAGPRPEQPLGRGSALPSLGAELELRRSGSSLGPSQPCSRQMLTSFAQGQLDTSCGIHLGMEDMHPDVMAGAAQRLPNAEEGNRECLPGHPCTRL